MADRLRDATSPYLLQHADNPVDWWPWSEAAFAEARCRDVPVLLSVGYSACHWCHVMAHESFEDTSTAGLVNDHLVAIKVDREERPDVDAVYMTATQAMTGQGGWPMTVFMTPDREPFYCGTYFPRDYFQRLVLGIARAWRDDRTGVIDQARQIAAALADSTSASRRGLGSSMSGGSRPGRSGSGGSGSAGSGSGGSESAGPADSGTADSGLAGLGLPESAAVMNADFLPPGLAESAVAKMAGDYDARRGGFGGAPKFPPSTALEFLLRHSERPPWTPEAGTPGQAGTPGPAGTPAQALAMAAGTAHAMARGGIYDQIGGGFARYSVDEDWIVPHFEKMLYDNAQLARVYAHLWRRSGDDLASRVAQETCDWMIADLTTGDGGFASSLDADSEGSEGAFYVWTPSQLSELLGPQDGEYAARLFAVTPGGTFESGLSVLQLPADPPDPDRFQRIRAVLLAARSARIRPARDDKVVAAWNGLAIAALADAGLLFGRPDYTEAATAAAELLVRVHLAGDRLARTSRDGVVGHSAGVLEDYACVAGGLIALSAATGQARWVTLAGRLLGTALERFGDAGTFFDTADDGEPLIYRPADPADGPTPSGTFALAGALLSYAALTGSARHRQAAAMALAPLPAIATRYPQAAGWGLAVAEAFLAGPSEIAIIGPQADKRTAELHRAAACGSPPGAVIALGHQVSAESAESEIPLLAGRGLVNGEPAAYVCRGFTCQMPVTTPEQLLATLRS
jgi:uncharacterized protein YyaL (SSP411 family)